MMGMVRVNFASLLIEFLIAWFVSGVAIYLALKIFPGKQRRETLGSSMAAALIGAVIFAVLNWLIPLVGGLVALVAWLWVLKNMFGVGWLGAAAIAFLVWLLSTIVGLFGIPRLL